jgi:hypothetical protein
MSLATASRSWLSFMLDYLVVLLVGLLGVAGGPWWVTLLGALALSAEVLAALIDERLKNRRVPDRHSAVLVVKAVSHALASCGASYIFGYLVGHW